jgi:hypothetical protein
MFQREEDPDREIRTSSMGRVSEGVARQAGGGAEYLRRLVSPGKKQDAMTIIRRF